jgi:hypothetical protein
MTQVSPAAPDPAITMCHIAILVILVSSTTEHGMCSYSHSAATSSSM